MSDKSTTALNVNKTFTSVILTGGKDVDPKATSRPDLWISGGAKIKKKLVAGDLRIVGNATIVESLTVPTILTGVIDEVAVNAGVTIENVLLKDGNIYGTVVGDITGSTISTGNAIICDKLVVGKGLANVCITPAEIDLQCGNITDVQAIFVDQIFGKNSPINVEDDLCLKGVIFNETWNDAIQSLAVINGSGNLQKDSTTGQVCLSGNLKILGNLFVGNIYGASPILVHDLLVCEEDMQICNIYPKGSFVGGVHILKNGTVVIPGDIVFQGNTDGISVGGVSGDISVDSIDVNCGNIINVDHLFVGNIHGKSSSLAILDKLNLTQPICFTESGIIIGDETTISTELSSVAIGTGLTTTSNKPFAIAIGYNATVNYSKTISIGYKAHTTTPSGISIGDAARCNSTSGMALGDAAYCGGSRSVAIGYSVSGKGNRCVTIGYDAYTRTAKSESVSIGYDVQNNASYAIALGPNATVFTLGDNAVAIGNTAIVNNIRSVAIGGFARATQIDTVAIGGGVSYANGARAAATGAIAIGSYSVANQAHCVQLGQSIDSGTDAQLKFRSQVVSDESWIDTANTVAAIDETGNFYKTSFPTAKLIRACGQDFITNTNTSVTVSTAVITANSQVFLTLVNPDPVGPVISVGTVVPDTSFTIESDTAAGVEGIAVNWLIVG